MKAGAALRWTGCAAFVLMAHAGVALSLAQRDTPQDAEEGVAIPIVEFAPELAALAGPLNDTLTEDETQPPEPERTEAPAPAPEQMQSEQAPPDPETLPEPVPPASVTAAATPPPPQENEQSMQIAIPDPPTEGPTAAAPAFGTEEKREAAKIAQWQRALVQRLQRAKRFPKGARGVTGTVRVAFSIDRQGKLTARRVLSSSGSNDLDREALSLLDRAQPFSPAPVGVNDSELSFVLPVHFSGHR